MTAPAVKGKYLRHTPDRGFLYEYACPCGRTFIDVCPELSAPALCSLCYHGRDRPGTPRTPGKSRRKGSHKGDAE